MTQCSTARVLSLVLAMSVVRAGSDPRGYPDCLARITLANLHHETPTTLSTSLPNRWAANLIDRYARRAVIENAISGMIVFLP
ncbi:MAG: hypothetical protein OXN89_02975 [Bryobacterales bacterium]|nr:hypothetical protein [Bryobacterales bacterium]